MLMTCMSGSTEHGDEPWEIIFIQETCFYDTEIGDTIHNAMPFTIYFIIAIHSYYNYIWMKIIGHEDGQSWWLIIIIAELIF